MQIAVLGADFKERKIYAESLAKKYGLPLITGCFDVFQDLDVMPKEQVWDKLRESLNNQIKKQIFHRKVGYVTDGCTLDYIALYKIYMDIFQEGKMNIPEIIRARLHTWHQISRIIYLPRENEKNEMFSRYDSYLIKEFQLIKNSNNVSIKIIAEQYCKGVDKFDAEDLRSENGQSAFV